MTPLSYNPEFSFQLNDAGLIPRIESRPFVKSVILTFLDDVTLTTANRFTFHSPDTHFVNAELGSILKLETEEYMDINQIKSYQY